MKIPGKNELALLLEAAENGKVEPKEIAWLSSLIDHTSLKPGVTEPELKTLCREAREFGFGAVCVREPHVAFCVRELSGSEVKTVSVVGFPTGEESTEEKARETQKAVQAGATEIDMVLNGPLLKKGSLHAVLQDIEAVVQTAGSAPVKVILETCLLNQDEKLIASALAKAAGAAFLKTSTGFSTGGATVEDVALLRSVARDTMGVKASGGVRSLPDALRMILAGANRLGTSSGPAILGKSPQAGESRVY